MRVSINKNGLKTTKELTDHIVDRVSKLSQFSERIVEAQVALKVDKATSGENKIVEIKLVIPGHDLYSEKRSARFEDSLMSSLTAIEHQLRRWKELRDSWHM